MPNILGYIHAIASVFLTKDNAFGNRTVIVVGGHSYLTAKYHKGLILVGMVMDGDFGSGFQRITLRVSSSLQGKVKVNFTSALASFVS